MDDLPQDVIELLEHLDTQGAVGPERPRDEAERERCRQVHPATRGRRWTPVLIQGGLA